MSLTALIDYGMGNLLSVSKALTAAGGEVRIVRTPEEAHDAARLILPGVGNFGEGMEHLHASGFVPFLRNWAADGKPLLGICLGYQMMFDSSEEAPGVEGLGILPGRVLRFPSGKEKVPHIGWNSVTVNPACGSAFFDTSENRELWFYFVHSYYVRPDDPACTAAECDYILPFAAAAARGSLLGVQFHPEKSQSAGLRLIRNFLQHTKQ